MVIPQGFGGGQGDVLERCMNLSGALGMNMNSKLPKSGSVILGGAHSRRRRCPQTPRYRRCRDARFVCATVGGEPFLPL